IGGCEDEGPNYEAGTGGSDTSGEDNSGGRGSGGAGATAGAGGAIEGGECDLDLLDREWSGSTSTEACNPGSICRLPLTCTSGIDRELIYVCNEVTLTYRLDSNQAGTACDHPYEGCVASQGITYDCRDDEWQY